MSIQEPSESRQLNAKELQRIKDAVDFFFTERLSLNPEKMKAFKHRLQELAQISGAIAELCFQIRDNYQQSDATSAIMGISLLLERSLQNPPEPK